MAESGTTDKYGTLAFRELVPADIPALARLERACFASPWGEDALGKSMAGQGFTALGGFLEDELVCYSLLLLFAPEMELLNIAVGPERRRQGLGSRMLGFTLQWANKKAIEAVFLESRTGNVAALALYERFGFTRIGLRPGYYQDTGEDAVLFRRMLTKE